MGKMQRQKGKVGEREFANLCVAYGIRARRGRQYAGHVDAPDVILEDFPGVHVEVKRKEKLSIHPVMEQLLEEAGAKTVSVLAHRRNGQPWVCSMPAEQWLEMFKLAYGKGAGAEPDQEPDPGD